MIDSIMQLLKRLSVDLTRSFVLIIGIAILFWLSKWLPQSSGETALAPLLTSSAIIISVAAVSHVVRRVLFPWLDLKKVTKIALEHWQGAAVVFASVCYVLTVLMQSTIALLR